MEAVRILEKGKRIDWDYDEEADVLYLSLGKPRKATGVDKVWWFDMMKRKKRW